MSTEPLAPAGGAPGETAAVAAPPPPGTDAGGRPGRASLRPLVLRLHFYAGLLVAPFLLVAALTGFLYACSLQAEKIVYRHELSVPVGEGELPVSRQVEAAREAHPEGTVSAVRPSPEAGATTRVLLSGVPGVEEGRTLAVFVDPYTGEVRGALEQYGSSGALPLRTWIDEFHRDLHLGEPGRLYSELAASWLWVITGGGLVLWLGRRRTRSGTRSLLLPDRAATGRRRSRSLHGAVGTWAALGLFFLSATGLTWSAYAGANIGELREAIGQSTPVVSIALDGGHGDGHGGGHGDGADEHAGHKGAHGADRGTEAPGHSSGDVGMDAVLAAARAQGLSDPVEIVPPAEPGTAYTVRQIQRSWPEKQDAVAVHPATGEVTDTVRFEDHPLLAKLTRWGIDAHMGTLFGVANQAVLAALALALVFLILWGYRMWWQRGRGRAFGRAIPRGAWRQAPPRLLLPLAAGAAAVGWFVPLLGIPLLAFLVLDTVLGAVLRRRNGRTGEPAAAGRSAGNGT
ncbi:PepSY-associated TM helix domain-containing protein [Streptomyces glaucosporus]|uniref:PepSY-associated TM helix domain-containing protein n=1 Tax=Streptomyces glaucosporus TaxID=284044 RepID=A0ABP5VSC0_9ACTN